MAELPTFAVLVPYFSNAEYLRLALESVRAQSDPAWWCVVIDDSGRSSEAANVVTDLDDARIRLERNARTLGVAANFERCFDVARQGGAELATILHADDLLERDYVSVMRAAHRRHDQAACVAPRVTVVDADGRPTRTVADVVKRWLTPRTARELQGEHGLRLLLRGQFFYCPAVSYRVSAMPDRAWDDRWKQVMDLDLYGRLLLGDQTIALEPARLYRYRRHAGTMTEINSASLVRTEEEALVLGELAAAARDRGWRRAARTGRWRLTVRSQALLRMAGALRHRRWDVARRALRLAVGR